MNQPTDKRMRYNEAELDAMFERSKIDHISAAFVGSEVRVLIGMARESLATPSSASVPQETALPVVWQCKQGLAVEYVYDAESADRAAHPIGIGPYGKPWEVIPLYAAPVAQQAAPSHAVAPQPPASEAGEFTVGAYTLRAGMQKGRIWIEHETGEGSDFMPAQLEAVIAAFYKEHF